MLKKGFTLAEILLTLGIIGVVATITLPSLNHDITNQTLEKQVMKFYSTLHDAIAIGMASGGVDLNNGYIRKNLNVVSVCDSNNRADCLGKLEAGDTDANKTRYTTINSSTNEIATSTVFPNPTDDGSLSYIFVLADGTVFQVNKVNGEEKTPSADKEDGIQPMDVTTVVFDVNGDGGPNKYGKDLWMFTIFEDATIDDANLSPEQRQGLSPRELSSRVDANFEACKAGFAFPHYSTKMVGNEAKPQTQHVASCFGKLMRSKFKMKNLYGD